MSWIILFAISALVNVAFVILQVRAEILLKKRTAELNRAAIQVIKYNRLVEELQAIGKDETSMLTEEKKRWSS